jgi:Glycosyl hydrolases family 28
MPLISTTRSSWCLAAGAFLFLFGSAAQAQQPVPARFATCDVRAYGAAGDGKQLDTAAINAAIRACAKAGGGTVELTPGTYLSGTIVMLTNITLQLDPGATLLGNPDVRDYTHIGRVTEGRSSALIVAVNAANIAITGHGVIDGNGRAFIHEPHLPHPPGPFLDPLAMRQGQVAYDALDAGNEGPLQMRNRPGVLVLFVQCQDVTIRDITVLDAPNWCIHLACCKYALLTGLNVRCSLRVPNADAIDLGSSQNVRVSDSYFEAGDDGIAIGPCADGYCKETAENIVISNCVIVSRSAAIRVGYAAAGIRDVTVDNVIIRDSNRGICVQVRGDETIENVLFSNIIIQTRFMDGLWWGLGEPITITAVRYSYEAAAAGRNNGELKGPLGMVRNLRFVNVTAKSESPVVLYSQDPGHIRDILFSNYRQTIKETSLHPNLGGNLDLRPTTPAKLGVIKYDMAALTAHGVDNLELHGFDVDWQGSLPDYYTSGIAVSDFKNLRIDDFEGSGPHSGTPAIDLRKGENATVLDSRADEGGLLSIRDVSGRKVLLGNQPSAN